MGLSFLASLLTCELVRYARCGTVFLGCYARYMRACGTVTRSFCDGRKVRGVYVACWTGHGRASTIDVAQLRLFVCWSFQGFGNCEAVGLLISFRIFGVDRTGADGYVVQLL